MHDNGVFTWYTDCIGSCKSIVLAYCIRKVLKSPYSKKVFLLIINPLIKEAFNLNNSMHDNGVFTWYTFAKEIFAEFEKDK
jgi:DUF971 family protein